MAEADDHLLFGDAPRHIGLGFVGRVIAADGIERELVGAAVLRPLERADSAGDRGVQVGAGAGDDAAGESRGIEFVLGVEDQRGMHRAYPQLALRLAVQQREEVAGDRVVVGFHFDAPARMREVVPVQQHRAEARHQPVGDVARLGQLVILAFRQHRAERRAGGTHHVHRVAICRDALENVLHQRGDAALRLELPLVGGELGLGRQLAVYQQIGDFLEFAAIGDVENVVAAIVEVVAAAPDRAQGCVSGRDSGQGDRFLRFNGGCGFLRHAWLLGDTGTKCYAPRLAAINGCCSSAGLLTGKQSIELAFVVVVVEELVQLRPGLHRLDHALLRAVGTNRAIYLERRGIHRAERGQRIKHHADVGGRQLLDRKQRRRAELGDVSQNRYLDRVGELPIHAELGHRLGEDHVGACLDVGAGALDGGVQSLDGERVGARHDDERRIAARVRRRLDAIGHFLLADDGFAGPMAAAFRLHLILDMTGRGAELVQRFDRALNVEGAAEAGIDVHQQRRIDNVGDAPDVGQHVVERGNAEIGQAQRAGCDAAARQVDRPIPGAGCHAGVIGFDRADDLQRGFGGEGGTEAAAGAAWGGGGIHRDNPFLCRRRPIWARKRVAAALQVLSVGYQYSARPPEIQLTYILYKTYHTGLPDPRLGIMLSAMTNVIAAPTFRPLYDQIKILLTQSLVAGEWKPGEAIPSEVELAARFGVSQETVRKAIDELP